MGATKYDWTDKTKTGLAKEEFDALWTAVNAIPVAYDLADLDDVVITAVADDEVLSWDSGTSKWINQTAAEAGLAVAGHDHDADYSAIAHDHDADYVEITGDTMTGELHASSGLRVSGGFFNIGVMVNVTISAGAVTATVSHHKLVAQSGSSDDLVTVNGGVAGRVLILRPNSGHTITLKASGGNLKMLDGADIVLSQFKNSATFLYHGTNWYEIAGLH